MQAMIFPSTMKLCAISIFSLVISVAVPGFAANPVGPAPAGEPSRPRVVSLVPEATEIIRLLGGEEMLVGMTIHDVPAADGESPGVVGGFAAPSLKRIIALDPDLIILADLHRQVREHFKDSARLFELKVDSLEQALSHIEQLGEILGREEAARQLISRHRTDLARVAEQMAPIPAAERRRMMRLMSTSPLGAPGDDSFQNDFIRAAGGIPPVFGRAGQIIALTPEEIQAFDPQVIYVCGERAEERVLNIEALQTVDAVRNRRILVFPCNLTCRAGANIGSFVQQLAARAYEDQLQTPLRQP
jgi:iron complex transport system substrate-binding protein